MDNSNDSRLSGSGTGLLLYRIASLRPPRIPVTLNRRSLMLNAVSRSGLSNNRSHGYSLSNPLIQSEFAASRSETAMLVADSQRMKRELSRAHRSLESLCDRLLMKQNILYSQLCRYHKLKREASRRLYQLQQQQIRDGLLTRRNRTSSLDFWLNSHLGDESTPAHRTASQSHSDNNLEFDFDNDNDSDADVDAIATETAEGHDKGRSSHLVDALNCAHLQTILKSSDYRSFNRRSSLPPGVSIATKNAGLVAAAKNGAKMRTNEMADSGVDLHRSVTFSNTSTTAVTLPSIRERNEPVIRPISAGTRLAASSRNLRNSGKVPSEIATETNTNTDTDISSSLSEWLREKRREKEANGANERTGRNVRGNESNKMNIAGKELVEMKFDPDTPFTIYRIDENGNIVPRDTLPRSFHKQAPSSKMLYRNKKLLIKERQNFENCLKRGKLFNPSLPKSSEEDAIPSPTQSEPVSEPRTRRDSRFYGFVSWVPM